MFLTKTALRRRTFLRGAGAAVSLPLLESMVPALTALVADVGATAAARRLRLRAERGDPRLLDTNCDRRRDSRFTPILAPLQTFRRRSPW